MTTSTMTAASGTEGRRSAISRNVWLIAGGLGLASLGLAAGLAWRPAPPQAELMVPATSVVETQASLSPNETVVETAEPTAPPVAPALKKQAPPAPRKAPAPTVVSTAPTPMVTQPVAICADCGVVEAVREVQQKGEASGLGAVAGGVLGGAIGNKMGKGNGRKAMTVIGAIGGGLAGHEVEKRARGETVYEVQVRMDDGSVRTLQQKTAPTPGTRVTVDGDTLRTTRSPDSGQMIRTGT
ncbi:glycine zipper 2TM domain-containing protein [Piscinibacter sp.]|uniref:glycine zipper 2TM domain-containing protein n=1 Tax=Piscinibacter sp. TaxID=1903157 RepID=UPI002C7A3886|nr:glycine zipper 2TM domain-containing protein [Albitalea sp.]HUG22571.1 glycine zipper 2TM domain-containing protein [Albitalea sp.]